MPVETRLRRRKLYEKEEGKISLALVRNGTHSLCGEKEEGSRKLRQLNNTYVAMEEVKYSAASDSGSRSSIMAKDPDHVLARGLRDGAEAGGAMGSDQIIGECSLACQCFLF